MNLKSIFLGAIFLLVSSLLPAQFAPLSPPAHLKQMVGNTYVTIDYNRPMVRGRKIFGSLVPYDKLWNVSASGIDIRFDRPVKVYNQVVPAGVYALQFIPGEKEWTVMFNTALNGRGKHDPSQDFVNVCVPVVKSSRFYESFTLDLDVSPGRAQLYISWADTQVSIPISTPSEESAMALIDSLLAAPLATDGDLYFRSANYLLFNGRDANKAIKLIERLMQHDKGEYPYRLLTRAYTILGQKEKALAAVEKGLEASLREYADNNSRLESLLEFWGEERDKVLAL